MAKHTLNPLLSQGQQMDVGVIGCGASGIVALRHLTNSGFKCVGFERSSVLGGTWVYSEDLIDRHGLPSPSAMYRNLRTNLPKEVMEFSELHYNTTDESFLQLNEVIEYLNQYSDHFDIRKHIKFDTLVKSVRPVGKNWEILAFDLNSKEERIYNFKSVLICNGHYSRPVFPDIQGQENFEGLKIHSQVYRKPETFKNMRVLIIGIGPSGQDIAYDLAPHVKKIYLSHHGGNFNFPDNVISKPDVCSFQKSTVTFKDDSIHEIDAILYCTGYVYDFPFLDKSCQIEVEENYVKPLFKQFINIEHPSMGFIGLPFRTFIFPLFEVQVMCFLNILLGNVELPSKREMIQDTEIFEESKRNKGYPKKRYHMLGLQVKDYIIELTDYFKVQPLPEVIYKIYLRTCQARKTDLKNYRDHVYYIIDDNNFTEEKRHGTPCRSVNPIS